MDLEVLALQAIFTVIWAAVLVAFFSRSARDPKEVGAWARAHALELTPRNQGMVTYYVRLAIVLRVIGGVAGVVLGSSFDDALGLDTSAGAGFWVWVVLGWLVGSGWAEYRLTRPGADDRAASLLPRQVTDYLSPRLYAAPTVAAGVAVVASLAGLVAPAPAEPQAEAPPDAALWLAALGAVLLAGLVNLAVRTVVARRQPTSHPDVLAADDAIRAASVHHLAGGGAAAILLIASQVAWTTMAPHHLPLGVRGWVPALLLLAAVVAWRWFAYQRWAVRRQAPSHPGL